MLYKDTFIVHDGEIGESPVYAEDFSYEFIPSIFHRNLLRFVCAVECVTVESRFESLFQSLVRGAELCLATTGMTLEQAVLDWNSSESVKKDPSRRVVLLSEV